jgi:hypothetical protein
MQMSGWKIPGHEVCPLGVRLERAQDSGAGINDNCVPGKAGVAGSWDPFPAFEVDGTSGFGFGYAWTSRFAQSFYSRPDMGGRGLPAVSGFTLERRSCWKDWSWETMSGQRLRTACASFS